MEYQQLEHFLSKNRLDRFLKATGNSKSKAQKLYRINLRVAQAFYPILNLFEIFLRNTIDYEMSKHFKDSDWVINQKSGFMSDPSLRKSKFFLKETVKKAEKKITRRGKVTSGKVIAELSLAFWTSLFDRHHYKLIKGITIHCFPNKPPHINRSDLSQKLTKIREFRNRVYHNEPICFNGSTIDFGEALDIKKEIYDLLSWIDSDLTKYMDYFNGVDAKIASLKYL